MMANQTHGVANKQALGEVYRLECKQIERSTQEKVKRENEAVGEEDNAEDFKRNIVLEIKIENKGGKEVDNEDFDRNTVTEIKKENEGGSEEDNEEDDCINIKKEKEDYSDLRQEQSLIITESHPPLSQATPVKKIVKKKTLVILKKIDVGTSATKRTLNVTPQIVKQIKLEEATEHTEPLTDAASALPNNNYEASDISSSQNLAMDLKEVPSKSNQIINSTINCSAINNTSAKDITLRKHNIQAINTFSENKKALTSYNAKNKIFKFRKNTATAAVSTLLKGSDEGDKSNINNKNGSEKRFTCHICHYKCDRKTILNNHLRIHTGEKPYVCHLCDYRCARKDILGSHVKYRHTKEKKYECHICQYKCLTKSNLNVHLRTHTGEKPYACDFCDFRSAQKCYISIHIKCKHIKEKTFACHLCPFKCVRKDSLRLHLCKHTKEKPYICDVCEYKCARKGTLIDHIKSKHTKEKKFSCDICQYKCVRKNVLNVHLRKHTREKPYKCDICDYRSAISSNLNTHILKRHTSDR